MKAKKNIIFYGPIGPVINGLEWKIKRQFFYNYIFIITIKYGGLRGLWTEKYIHNGWKKRREHTNRHWYNIPKCIWMCK